MDHEYVRHLMQGLRKTVFHPQWLSSRQDNFQFAVKSTHPRPGHAVLDIGCGHGRLRTEFPAGVNYFGFDYPATGIDLYQAKPHILGTAESLPIADSCIDIVVCLEVMEHLPDPFGAMREMARVLNPEGRAVVSVPFAYPIHDAPFDFQRITRYQLEHMAASNGLLVESLEETGHGLESAALLVNLAFSRSILDGFQKHHPVALFAPLLILTVPIINIAGWFFAGIAGECGRNFLPSGYRMVVRKGS